MKAIWEALLCELGFHVFTVWGVNFGHVYCDYQRRKCRRCGFISERLIGVNTEDKE